eukprot:GILK01014270.1.p1 GENE.GILK01014270.1~~GILK01014270.1.p1  ORF type:complete len:197 (+),score=17.06 GILK01014270.1:65-655(+)
MKLRTSISRVGGRMLHINTNGAERQQTHSSVQSTLRVNHALNVLLLNFVGGQKIALHPQTSYKVLSLESVKQVHLREIEGLMPKYRVRPSACLPVLNSAAFLLGVGSSLLPHKASMSMLAAMATSIAEHCNSQLREFNEHDVAEPSIRQAVRMQRDSGFDFAQHVEEAQDHQHTESHLTSCVRAATTATACLTSKI